MNLCDSYIYFILVFLLLYLKNPSSNLWYCYCWSPLRTMSFVTFSVNFPLAYKNDYSLITLFMLLPKYMTYLEMILIRGIWIINISSTKIRIPSIILTSFGLIVIGKREERVGLAVVRRDYINLVCEALRLICGDSWLNEPFPENIT